MHKRMSATKAILISFMCSLLKISLVWGMHSLQFLRALMGGGLRGPQRYQNLPYLTPYWYE